MALPSYSMRQLLEAGVHFGHQAHRWNPRMDEYIFGTRNKVHIIDLSQTVPMLHRGLKVIRDIVAGGGRVLFVGTKRQASTPIAEAAKRCGQYYVNHRWLGGTLTNWQTISNSIKRLKVLENQVGSEEAKGFTKKEQLQLKREQDKLERALGCIKEMGGLPDVLFVIDTRKEEIAIHEANRLGIPVVAIVDTNCDPSGINYPIPGNDDAARAINLYTDLVARSALDGIQEEMTDSGEDAGASVDPIMEELPAVEEIVESVTANDEDKSASEPETPAAKGDAPAAT
ncbi:MAG: 30S ribosomal protein S2 [Rhodospirillales bacterium]|nr:30S ribosomal protein S2 [Rhodospirillales bacterium]